MKKPAQISTAARRLKAAALCAGLLTALATPTALAADTYSGNSGDLKTDLLNDQRKSFYPGTYGSPYAAGNEVIINFTYSGQSNDAANPWQVYGGYSSQTIVSQNSVTLADGYINSYLYGGYDAGSSGAAENTVTIQKGEANTGVYGGYSSNGYVEGNKVFMYGGETGVLYGGYADAGDGKVYDNHVVIDVESGNGINNHSGTVAGGYAGDNASGDVSSNSVTLTKGEGGANLYGGTSSASGNVYKNQVFIDGANATSGTVYGGAGDNGSVYLNKVEMSAGAADMIRGGVRYNADSSAEVYKNEVTVSGGTVKYGILVGSNTGNGALYENTATVSGGAFSDGAMIVGAQSAGNGALYKNTVTVSAGSFDSITGGYKEDEDVNGDVYENAVTISGGSAHAVYGGYSTAHGDTLNNTVTVSGNAVVILVAGGLSTNNATGNTVNILGGILNKAGIYGGLSDNDATGNTVNISGGTLNDANIYGGFVNSGSASASKNTVHISGNPVLTDALLCGGAYQDGDLSFIFSGNTLNVDNFTGSGKLYGVNGFGNFIFVLPDAKGNGVLTTEKLYLSPDEDEKSAVTGLEIKDAGAVLQEEEVITLIASDDTSGYIDDETEFNGYVGLTEYVFQADVVNDNLVARVVKKNGVGGEAKTFSEGYLSRATLVITGYDYIVREGILNALAVTGGGKETTEGGSAGLRSPAPIETPTKSNVFAAVSFNDSRRNFGSRYLRLNGRFLLAGAAKGIDTKKGRLTLGGFIEGASGDYDGRGGSSPGGEGGVSYRGAGALLRFDKSGGETGRSYYDASLRFGRAKNDFTGAILNGGTKITYDSSSFYGGLHLGAGRVQKTGEGENIDAYGKLLYVYQGGDDVILSNGTAVNFEPINSLRFRGGLRWRKESKSGSAVHLGAALEYEFLGGAKATAQGTYSIEEPSIRGTTFIGEAGLSLKAKNALIDLKVEGYAGKRKGFGGGIQAKWFF